jgi:hypothetical protein
MMCDATKLPASIISCDGIRRRREAAGSSKRPSLEEMEITRIHWREVSDMTTALSGCEGGARGGGGGGAQVNAVKGFVWRGEEEDLHDARGGQERVGDVENRLRLARSSPEEIITRFACSVDERVRQIVEGVTLCFNTVHRRMR